MNVLGVELSEPLFAANGVTLTCERDEGPQFGGFYLDGERATVALRHDLPPDAFCHTLAHELAHGLQRYERWPTVEAHPALGPRPAV
jgi:hypothetical protein